MVRITIVALVTALLSPASVATLQAESARPRPVIEIETQNRAQLEMARWAIHRFEEAGLGLPDLKIVFPAGDLRPCNGAPATALTNQQPVELRICWNDKFIVLHELAHAWEARNLPLDRREPFMALRSDVDSWTGADVPWPQRGIEHAANVIAWGLLEDPYPISRTYPNDPDSLKQAFRLLADIEPLHDGGSPVTTPDRRLYEGRANPPLESGR